MPPQSRFGPPIGRLLLAVPLVIVVAATACRGFGIEAGPLALLVAFTPWFALLAALTLIAAVLLRAPESIVLGLVCVGVQAWWLAPLFLPPAQLDRPSRQLVVMASNLREGVGRATDIVAVVAQRGVDVLMLEELSQESLAALRRAGLEALLPNHAEFTTDNNVTGSGLWSRHPISAAGLLPGHLMDNVKATVTVEGRSLTAVVAHPASPRVTSHRATDRELALLRDQLNEITGPTIVGGDFNTTRDQVDFRRIEAVGYVDAATQAGSGLLFTWPNGTTWVPGLGETHSPLPLVAIDHVMTRDADLTCTGFMTYSIAGSDHLAVVAVLTGR